MDSESKLLTKLVDNVIAKDDENILKIDENDSKLDRIIVSLKNENSEQCKINHLTDLNNIYRKRMALIGEKQEIYKQLKIVKLLIDNHRKKRKEFEDMRCEPCHIAAWRR
jgi:negative regulator of sigma E activity